MSDRPSAGGPGSIGNSTQAEMKRPYLIFASVVAILFAGFWLHDWWIHRGLITFDAKDAPAFQVLKRMERQSGFAILASTNLNAKVTVHFRKTPIEQALDVVADQTEGRWQKVFLVGRDKAALQKLRAEVAARGTPFLMPSWNRMGNAPEALDPEKLRKGPVTPLAGAHPLHDAALAIALRSATPIVTQADWNPFIKALAPSFPNVEKAVKDLAGAASARWEQAYQFRVGGRGLGGGGGFAARGESGGGGGDGEGRGFRGLSSNGDGRTNQPFSAQMALLTDAQRAAMEKTRAEMQQRMAEFRAMTPAERAQRIAEMIDGGGSPAQQQRAQARALRRIMNTTPEQQVRMNQRFEKRLERLQQRMQHGSAPPPGPQGGR